MAAALMGIRSVQPFRLIDAGQGISFQGHDGLYLALLHGLLGSAELGRDAGALAHIPAPSGQEEAGASGNEEKDLRHRLKPESRPKRTGFDRRD